MISFDIMKARKISKKLNIVFKVKLCKIVVKRWTDLPVSAEGETSHRGLYQQLQHPESTLEPQTHQLQYKLLIQTNELLTSFYVTQLQLRTCESATCVQIEYRIESGITIQIRIESRIKSAIITGYSIVAEIDDYSHWKRRL